MMSALEDEFAKHSFEVYHTGGGCLAFARFCESGACALITDKELGLPTDLKEVVDFGFYDVDGDQVSYTTFRTAQDLLHYLPALVKAYFPDVPFSTAVKKF